MIRAAIIGTGNIGTDLLVKLLRRAKHLAPAAFVGIDAASDGLARARDLGVPTIATGIQGLLESPLLDDVRIVFDATSAAAHATHDRALRARGIRVIDLTPAAIGPYVVPVVNLDEHLAAPNLNMVTCGGQATIPIVAAVAQIAPVHYGEIVASISSRSAGPGTRANIDEFTQTTAKAIEVVGGARRGKAIIILNPAEPPLVMRDTVFTLSAPADRARIRASIEQMVARVREYVPGYRLKQEIQFDDVGPVNVPGLGPTSGLKTSVYLEVEGAGHYLPAYAGNLDIMTSAALACGERIAETL
ncbi:MAG TPA: acetaldehyde dehydrogenase (acetylating) [Kofleriaceae bacterium]|jgi:acetaldehyde dehydrogenase